MSCGSGWVPALVTLALTGSSLGAGAVEREVSALEVVQLSQEHYRGIRTLRADFSQVYRGHMARDEEHGILMLKKPRKMYWEYRDPVEKYLIADGKRAYFYVPRDRQVFLYELEDDRLFMFLMGKGRWRKILRSPLKKRSHLSRKKTSWSDSRRGRKRRRFQRYCWKLPPFPTESRGSWLLSRLGREMTTS